MTAKRKSGDKKDIGAAMREICLSFPEAEEFLSHGAPNFRVRGGKSFAMYAVNHHGDGRIALWLRSPDGVQDMRVRSEPEYYYVPPYVGPRGWLGVMLDRGLDWAQVAALVREAYEEVAPRALIAQIGETIRIEPPEATIAVEEFDALQSKRGKQVLQLMREVCLALPETSEALQFGSPVWRVGKKTFAGVHDYDARFKLAFWVGADRQAMLVDDPRYTLPAYMAHNGWIALDVTKHAQREEVEELAEYSYRHFALKRALKALDEARG